MNNLVTWAPSPGDVVERCLDDVANIWMKTEVLELASSSGLLTLKYFDDGTIEQNVPLEEVRLFQISVGVDAEFQEFLASESWRLEGPLGAFSSCLGGVEIARLEMASPALSRSGRTREESLWQRCGLAEFGDTWKMTELAGNDPLSSFQRYQKLALQQRRRAVRREAMASHQDKEDVQSWQQRNGAPVGFTRQDGERAEVSQHRGWSCQDLNRAPTSSPLYSRTEALRRHFGD
eukprot:TRINITY_DN13304_c4_g1_i1.p1 TRINITY_DN13304_c4_g1~~TRINITY_DN13304_c4_g1_i1.p1  ORF type:complete len:234 (+),score=47.57 TRINITY_DN13304_c4_g1_i1:41-742(+)